jgi:ribonuclease P protein component
VCQTCRRVDRLRKTDDFSSVFAFRRSVRSEHFQLLYRPSGLKSPRLGVAVAKKLAPRAVDRNLVKRLAREAFRMLRIRLPAYDLVLRLCMPLEGQEKLVVRAEIDGLLGRLPR